MKSNSRQIIEVDLHGKIETELLALSEAMKTSDKTYYESKEVFKNNITIIRTQLQLINDAMVRNEDLKTKLYETEQKLKNTYNRH